MNDAAKDERGAAGAIALMQSSRIASHAKEATSSVARSFIRFELARRNWGKLLPRVRGSGVRRIW